MPSGKGAVEIDQLAAIMAQRLAAWKAASVSGFGAIYRRSIILMMSLKSGRNESVNFGRFAAAQARPRHSRP